MLVQFQSWDTPFFQNDLEDDLLPADSGFSLRTAISSLKHGIENFSGKVVRTGGALANLTKYITLEN